VREKYIYILFRVCAENMVYLYFDSTDLLNHKSDFIDMRKNGWEVNEDDSEELPSYLPARRTAIADGGFESFGWGYKKA